jgi:hypothetical protein
MALTPACNKAFRRIRSLVEIIFGGQANREHALLELRRGLEAKKRDVIDRRR